MVKTSQLHQKDHLFYEGKKKADEENYYFTLKESYYKLNHIGRNGETKKKKVGLCVVQL